MARQGFPVLWVVVPLIGGVGFALWLYSDITAKMDEAKRSAPVLVSGNGASDRAEAELTAATVRLIADLAAGRSDGAYQQMSEAYRAQVSRERFAAGARSALHLPGAHDVAPTHWTIRQGTAEVLGTVEVASGARDAFSVRFARDPSSWRATGVWMGGVAVLPQGPP